MNCLKDFSKSEHQKNPQMAVDNTFKCTICLKVAKHLPMHKFLAVLLQELKFKCNDCKRSFPLKKLKTHKRQNLCHRQLAQEEEGDDED